MRARKAQWIVDDVAAGTASLPLETFFELSGAPAASPLARTEIGSSCFC